MMRENKENKKRRLKEIIFKNKIIKKRKQQMREIENRKKGKRKKENKIVAHTLHLLSLQG